MDYAWERSSATLPATNTFGGVRMYAVIKTGGKQYKVAEGQVLRVEKLNAEVNETVELQEVLLVADGENVKVGTPVVRSEEHTSELQSRQYLVCRLLLEK